MPLHVQTHNITHQPNIINNQPPSPPLLIQCPYIPFHLLSLPIFLDVPILFIRGAGRSTTTAVCQKAGKWVPKTHDQPFALPLLMSYILSGDFEGRATLNGKFQGNFKWCLWGFNHMSYLSISCAAKPPRIMFTPCSAPAAPCNFHIFGGACGGTC